MKLILPVVFLVLVAFALPAQEGHGVTTADIQRGGQIFLTSCATCHGPNGDLVSGVNLASNRFRRAQTDSDLMDLVKKGIPSTPMPPGNYSDEQAFAIVAYLRSLANARPGANGAGSGLAGDPARGKSIVEGKGQCGSCHRIGNTGGFAGPDLTAIGTARSRASLEAKLLDPNADIRESNRPVRAVAKDGKVIVGTLLNYDNYSIQMLGSDGKLRALQIDKLKEYELMKTSPMPSYKDKLSAQEIADVAGYLSTLRGQTQ